MKQIIMLQINSLHIQLPVDIIMQRQIGISISNVNIKSAKHLENGNINK